MKLIKYKINLFPKDRIAPVEKTGLIFIRKSHDRARVRARILKKEKAEEGDYRICLVQIPYFDHKP